MISFWCFFWLFPFFLFSIFLFLLFFSSDFWVVSLFGFMVFFRGFPGPFLGLSEGPWRRFFLFFSVQLLEG